MYSTEREFSGDTHADGVQHPWKNSPATNHCSKLLPSFINKARETHVVDERCALLIFALTYLTTRHITNA